MLNTLNDLNRNLNITAKSATALMDKFNIQYKPSFVWPWATHQVTRSVTLYAPLHELSAGLAVAHRLGRRLKKNYTFKYGSPSTDGLWRLVESETEPVTKPVQQAAPTGKATLWLQALVCNFKGIPAPTPPVSEADVLEKLIEARKLDEEHRPALKEQKLVGYTVTYNSPEIEPALKSIIASGNSENSVPVELDFVLSTTTQDILDKLWKDWFIVRAKYSTSPLPQTVKRPAAAKAAVISTVQDLTTEPNDLSPIDPEDDLSGKSDLSAELNYHGKSTKGAIKWDGQQSVVVGRCGPQKAALTALMSRISAGACFSSKAESSPTLQFDSTGATVTQVGALDFFGPDGLRLQEGYRLYYPVSISRNDATLVFNKS